MLKHTLGIAFLFIFGYAANAQNTGVNVNNVPNVATVNTSAANDVSNTAQRQMADPTKKAAKLTSAMASELGLDQATTSRVGDINLSYLKALAEARTNSDPSARKMAAKKAKSDYEMALQSTLSKDQFTAYLKGKQDIISKREGRRLR